MAEFYLESQKTYNGRYMYLSCTQEALPEENKSIVYWTLTVTGGESSYYTTGPTTVTIDGQTVYYAPKVYYNAPEFPASKGSVSGQLEISHLSDGTRSVECSIKTAIYNGVMQENKATWALEAIPQESTVLATDCYIGSTSVVLVDRKSSAYTHVIGFCTEALEGFLCADGTLSQDPVKLEATTIPFQVPAYLYDRIPDGRKIECAFICNTYLGDVPVGQAQKCTFFASCREEDCLPTVTGAVEDCNSVTLALTGDSNVLVRFFSTASCQICALPQKGAALAQMQVNGTQIPAQYTQIANVETGTFLFQATDSRGYIGSCSVGKTLIPYVKLTAVATAKRLEPTGDRVHLAVEGNCFWGDFGLQENDLQVVYVADGAEVPLEITPLEGGYIAQGYLDASYQQSHLVQVVARDKLMEVSVLVRINPGVPVFDWGDKDFAFHVPVTLADGALAVSQKMLLDLIYPVNSVLVRYDHTDPGVLFGGVWERLADPQTGEGVFLLGVPQGTQIGSFGGEAEVTLTQEQIPNHSHGYLDYWTTTAGSGSRCAVALNGDGAGLDEKANDRSCTAHTGGGAAHNNMPPYVTVSVWRRVA